MKATILAIALAASSAPYLISAPPAEAQGREFKYCLQGRGVGIPGDCSYTSFNQCMATASGRALTCNINPRYAFANQRGGRRGYDRGNDGGYGYRY